MLCYLVQILNDAILKFDLSFAVTDKKINLAKEKDIQNKDHFFVYFWAKKDPL